MFKVNNENIRLVRCMSLASCWCLLCLLRIHSLHQCILDNSCFKYMGCIFGIVLTFIYQTAFIFYCNSCEESIVIFKLH